MNNDSPERKASGLAGLWNRRTTAPLILLAACLAVFAPELFGSASRAISAPGTDADLQFLYWRQMGYDALRHGHILLWNPYVYGGVPFVGGWQAEMLYPPNLIYLVVPVAKAIDIEFALHVYLAGLFMCLWAQRKGFGTAAALVAGAMTMFGGPFFLHVYAGHLSPIDAMAWAPLILLAVDAFLETPTLKWGLVGSGALALQVLAGHPQTVFMTVVAAAVLTVLRCLQSPPRWRLVPALALVATGGAALSAAQLGAGLAAAAVGTRHGAVPYDFAASLSFPIENLLTVLAPNLFGKIGDDYWGQYYLWEMSAYMGVFGLVLAKFGAWNGRHPDRVIWSVAAVIFVVIALAAHTPLFPILYKFVPGFNKFRSHSKFFYEALLFSSLLAAAGMQRLVDDPKPARRFAIVLALAAVLVLGIGAALKSATPGSLAARVWERSVPWSAIAATKYGPDARTATAVERINLARASGENLLLSGAMFALVTGFLALSVSRPRLATALALAAVAELAVYARSTVTTFPIDKPSVATLANFRALYPGDYRMLFNWASDDAVAARAYDLWGYDPSTVGRYAELMSRLQGIPPSDASTYLTFDRYLPLYRILRCRFFLWRDAHGTIHVAVHPGDLPHVLIVPSYAVMPNRDAVYTALTAPGFQPEKTAVLESPPQFEPAAALAGPAFATLRERSNDSLLIYARATSPCVLLVTDAYADGWTVAPVHGAQREYRVVPADYALMGIPLSAGEHLIRLEYKPTAWSAGVAVSSCAVVVYAMLWLFVARKERRKNF